MVNGYQLTDNYKIEDLKFITLQGLKEVLSDGELKNVLGGSGCATPCLITGNGNAACATLQDGQNLANRGFAVNCCLPNACCN
ncbi:hypothetical protein FACS189420_0100 [Bacteroidia bacterium]|nr:hypothetical protein FACS18947_0060 [Bacteroidia bacterium]GHV70161.1 hypothetical protein FACS189420_0100 [Bacteroidia bacterium]